MSYSQDGDNQPTIASYGREGLNGLDIDHQDDMGITRSTGRGHRTGGYGGFMNDDKLSVPSDNDGPTALRQRGSEGDMGDAYGRGNPLGKRGGNDMTYGGGPGGKQIESELRLSTPTLARLSAWGSSILGLLYSFVIV